MTKNILYICLAALLAYSCEQKESFIFAETDGLYFALPDSKEQPWTSAEPETLNHKLDFPFKETGERDTDGYFPYIYGDTPRTDSIRLFIAVAGNSSDQPREYHLKAETVNDSTEMADIVLPEVCILAPPCREGHCCCLYQQPPENWRICCCHHIRQGKITGIPG